MADGPPLQEIIIQRMVVGRHPPSLDPLLERAHRPILLKKLGLGALEFLLADAVLLDARDLGPQGDLAFVATPSTDPGLN